MIYSLHNLSVRCNLTYKIHIPRKHSDRNTQNKSRFLFWITIIIFVPTENIYQHKENYVLTLSLGCAVLILLHQCLCARSRTRVKFSFNDVKKTSETHWIFSLDFLYDFLFPPWFQRPLFWLNSDSMCMYWWHWTSISYGDTRYH